MKKFLSFLMLVIVMLTASNVTGYAFSMGDVDGNGKVSAADARMALRYSARLEGLDDEQLKAADTDGNGSVTASDARKILRVASKLDRFAEEEKQTAVTTEKSHEKENGIGIPTVSENDSNAVCITPTGARYHTSHCRTLKNQVYYVTLENAISYGYTACKVCKP